MNTNIRFIGKLSVTLFVLFMMVPATSFAVSYTFDWMVASECAPQDHDDVKKLELKDGQWQFKHRDHGTAVLECPINTLGNLGTDNIGTIVLFYRDSNGSDDDANLTFTLFNRELFGTINTFGSHVSDENDTSDYSFEIFEGFLPVNTEFWAVRVELYRKDRDDANVSFHGMAIGAEE